MGENIQGNNNKRLEEIIKNFNMIEDAIIDPIRKESPTYRLYNEIDTSKLSIEEKSKYLNIIDSLYKKIKRKNYTVEIVEMIDVKEVNYNKDRYRIIIKNDISGVYYQISLKEFNNNLLDYSFDIDDYIITIIKMIEGTKSVKEIKELKELILEYLSYILYFKETFTLEYNTVGWDKIYFNGETTIFKYDKIYSNKKGLHGRITKSSEDLYSLSTSNAIKNETYENKWMMYIIRLMNNHVYDSILFSVGISGIIRQNLIYDKESNLNINITGEPASGKSSLGHLILSFFGNPSILEGASIDTENAIERIRIERPVLPYVLDERMLRYYVDTDKNKSKKLMMEIFREYEGKERERLGRQYEEYAGKRTYGPIISSSVESLFDSLKNTSDTKDYGQYRRIIEFKVGNASDEVLYNKEEIKESNDIANVCYGYGVRCIVNYMLFRLNKDKDYFNKEYNNMISNVKEYIYENKYVTDIVNMTSRFSLILLSYKVLRESILFKVFNKIKLHKAAIAYDETKEVDLDNSNSADDYNLIEEGLEDKEYDAEVESAYIRVKLAHQDKELSRDINYFDNLYKEMFSEFNEVFMTDDFDKFIQADNASFIKNQHDKILDELCKNQLKTIDIIDHINTTSNEKNKYVVTEDDYKNHKQKLIDYIMLNYKEHHDMFCPDKRSFDKKHIIYFEEDDKTISLKYLENYKLEHILLNKNIIEFNEILQNIIQDDNKYFKIKDTWENFYKKNKKEYIKLNIDNIDDIVFSTRTSKPSLKTNGMQQNVNTIYIQK